MLWAELLQGAGSSNGGNEASTQRFSHHSGQLVASFLEVICLIGCHFYFKTAADVEGWAVSCLLGRLKQLKGGLLLRPLQSAAETGDQLIDRSIAWAGATGSSLTIRDRILVLCQSRAEKFQFPIP